MLLDTATVPDVVGTVVNELWWPHNIIQVAVVVCSNFAGGPKLVKGVFVFVCKYANSNKI